tara:strand:- start:6804 stop:7307 length:504 start_codon:yes stop_codon:yes gene_type:complete
MASRRIEHQEEVKFKVFQIINENSQMTTREIAQKVGISNGSAYFLLTSLIDMGFIKLSNFKYNSQKIKYSYLLTLKVIREKSLATNKFFVRKKKKYELLQQVIHYQKNINLRVNILISNLDILENVLVLCLDMKPMLWLKINGSSNYVPTELDYSLKQGDLNGHGYF